MNVFIGFGFRFWKLEYSIEYDLYFGVVVKVFCNNNNVIYIVSDKLNKYDVVL